MSLPNREELSFLIVFALPNAYRISLHPRILSYIPNSLESFLMAFVVFMEMSLERVLSLMMLPMFLPREARNFKQYLVF